MKIELSTAQKNLLETRYQDQVERDGRVRDRIKAVLLKSERWTNKAIGQALRIHSETVAQHLRARKLILIVGSNWSWRGSISVVEVVVFGL